MIPLTVENTGGTLGEFKNSLFTISDARGATHAIVLSQGFDGAALNAVCETYAGLNTAQQALNSELYQAIHERDVQREAIVNHMIEFGGLARAFKSRVALAYVAGTLKVKYQKSNKLTSIIEGAGVIILEWQKINEIVDPDVPHPLILRDGTTLAQFTAAHAALQAVGERVVAARNAARLNRTRRRQFIDDVVRPRLVEYRALIKVLYPRNHAFVKNLPRANPLPGSTPAGVILTGGWNAVEQKASLSWTACEHPDLEAYEVRACIDGAYHTDEDTVVARLPKTTLAYNTGYGLVATGSEARFRIYAITTVGRERGSNTVHVVRPQPVSISAAA